MADEFASAPCSLCAFDLEGRPVPPVERAVLADAAQIAAVLASSIRELCAADHGDNPATIARWCANKTAGQVRAWIEDSSQTLLVSRAGAEVAAVGAFRGDEVLLNYVAPEHRFAGHSKAMLAAIEMRMRGRGVATGRLVTTQTAHDFYRARGWRDEGEAVRVGALLHQRMTKGLAP